MSGIEAAANANAGGGGGGGGGGATMRGASAMFVGKPPGRILRIVERAPITGWKFVVVFFLDISSDDEFLDCLKIIFMLIAVVFNF